MPSYYDHTLSGASINRRRPHRRERGLLLLTLWLIDTALVMAHITTGVMMEKIPPLLNIAMDHSAAEYWGYGKWALIVALLLWLWRRTEMPAMLAFAALFLLMLLDDALMLHEYGGAALAPNLPAVRGIAPQDLGELVFWGFSALLMTPLFAVALVRTHGSEWRPVRKLFALLAAFGFFAVVVDQSHSLFNALPRGTAIADLVEEGGEMMVASAILAWLSIFRARFILPR